MLNIIKNWFTARDNLTYSLSKLLAISAGIEVMVKFWKVDVPDYQGFGVGIAAIIVALAAKYYVEGTKNASQD